MVSGEEAASAGNPQSAETLAGMRQGPPLTPAEKQRRYRQRHGDKVRERERLRVAAKRKANREGSPLSDADRAKAYRERGGDELRERERLRKAAKRKADD